jgi:2,4-dienoyl-CoA reductase-like NADH-dependent reductase (Old Yellow Enzyme family)
MSKLFEPISIGTLEAPNRFVRSATAERLSDGEGHPLSELKEMYVALARGGVGLIITGHAYVHPGGRCHAGMSGIYDDSLIEAWSEITGAVREAGARIAIQINHGGRQCDPAVIDGPLLAPSPIPLSAGAPRPGEMGERDIRRTIHAFADAAGRAKEAGFDAVQIHGAHGYLVHAFNSPASNWRRDAWGGILTRRMRFLEEVTAAVRDVVGGEYPVFIKLGTVDFCRDGLTEDDGVEIISHLADMGLDAVEISGGIANTKVGARSRHAGNTRTGIRSQEDEAYFLPIARKARAVTDLPILLVGGMRSREVMERVLDEGSADMISICRPLIREPDLPNRLRDGQPAATCISCNQCWPREGELGISCHYHPEPAADGGGVPASYEPDDGDKEA